MVDGKKAEDVLDPEFQDERENRPGLSRPEPPPIHNNNPAVWSLVIKDMAERDASGASKYGTRLQPFNGRKALIDLYQELLDAVVYLRQVIYEQEGK
jgi:hypothetical protein